MLNWSILQSSCCRCELWQIKTLKFKSILSLLSSTLTQRTFYFNFWGIFRCKDSMKKLVVWKKMQYRNEGTQLLTMLDGRLFNWEMRDGSHRTLSAPLSPPLRAHWLVWIIVMMGDMKVVFIRLLPHHIFWLQYIYNDWHQLSWMLSVTSGKLSFKSHLEK